jgi:predicted pyridoxine 5'-phosphate oxidase superfamily flavin-nucleotide-binding protein
VLGPAEVAFIEARDGFYQATVSETGWPYVQYRGGPAGFVRAVSSTTIGYADLRGNRQYISVGNLAGNDRVALLFVDHATPARLKLFGRARLIEDTDEAHLDGLGAHADRGRIERAVLIDVVAATWNCPQHITRRFTADEVRVATAPLLERITQLEQQLAERSC